MKKELKELRDVYYSISKSNAELGISLDSILDEVYELWSKGCISEQEFDAFLDFANKTNHSDGYALQISRLQERKEQATRESTRTQTLNQSSGVTMKDCKGQTIKVGDKVVYVKGRNANAALDVGTVTKIYENHSEKECSVGTQSHIKSFRVMKI